LKNLLLGKMKFLLRGELFPGPPAVNVKKNLFPETNPGFRGSRLANANLEPSAFPRFSSERCPISRVLSRQIGANAVVPGLPAILVFLLFATDNKSFRLQFINNYDTTRSYLPLKIIDIKNESEPPERVNRKGG